LWLVISESTQAIQSVEGCRLVAFGESWIVENCVDEIGDFAFQQQHGLADVQEFCRIFPEDVHTQQFQCFPMEEKFQPPIGVAGGDA